MRQSHLYDGGEFNIDEPRLSHGRTFVFDNGEAASI